MQFVEIFLLGLCVGSFLNVLVDRLPREESVIQGRSYCESCKKELRWYDLIPLFSYISLKGKCRYCRISLSIYYPLVEFVTGIVFVSMVILTMDNFQLNQIITLAYNLFIASSLIVIFFTDLKYGIIPDKIIFPSIAISIIYLFLNPQLSALPILSALGAFLFFLLLFLGTRGRGMGFGDVKLAIFMGIILGFPNIIVALYLAFLTGAIVGVIIILWKKERLKGATMPFGPFLVFGTFLALVFGNYILEKTSPLLYPLLHP